MRPSPPLQHCVARMGVCLSGLLLCGLASAVAPPFRVIGTDDGLPSAGINHIAQDRGGYLWLATDDGLARFDGRDFQIWRRRAGEAGSLPGNRILSVAPVEGERLQLDVAGHGRWQFDRLRQRVMPSGESPPPRADASRVLQDRSGGHWRVGPGGLRHHPVAGARGWPLPAWPGPVRALFEDREGGLWFGADGVGLLHLPGTWRAFHLLRQPSGAGAGALAPAGRDAVWLADATGLSRLSLATARRQAIRVGPAWPTGTVQALAERADGSLWLAQGRALSRLSPGPDGGWLLQAQAPAAWPVRQLLETVDGALWLVGEGHFERRDPAGARQTMAGLPPLWRGPDGQAWRRQGQRLQRWTASS